MHQLLRMASYVRYCRAYRAMKAEQMRITLELARFIVAVFVMCWIANIFR